jgi:hypothetical protein
MNVWRSALWLSTACAALVLSARAGASVGSSEAVPLATGLVFTTTSHAGLATTAGSGPIADTESAHSIVGTDDERIDSRAVRRSEMITDKIGGKPTRARQQHQWLQRVRTFQQAQTILQILSNNERVLSSTLD